MKMSVLGVKAGVATPRSIRILLVLSAFALMTAACGNSAPSTEGDTGSAAAGDGEMVIVGLVSKTESDPFFVKMREGAQEKADELGVELRTFAGAFDGDNDSQVQAVEDLISAGAAGILITASDTKAIVPTLEKAKAAGLIVIALDTPLDPPSTAHATFATDNFLAGELIGKWAAASVGDTASAKIAMLDLAENQSTVGVLRDQGFLQGFGIDLGDPDKWGDEEDPRIIGHEATAGSEEGGVAAMDKLLATDPDINLVYTVNESAAVGAKAALDVVGAEGVLIVSIGGGCAGVADVSAGVIGATSMEFPVLMASLGVEAVAAFAADGAVPESSPGLEFFDSGVELITDSPIEGVESLTSAEGAERCWG